MKKLLGLILLLIVLAGLFLFYRARTERQQAAEPAADVGLVQLLQNSAEFDGKLVRVTGYMHQQTDDSAIYLHPEDSAPVSALWVNVPDGQAGLGGHFVVCEGTFSSAAHGHGGAFGGEMVKVRRIQAVP